MPLSIGGSGSAKPYTKYNAKADKWFFRDSGDETEIGRPTFIADLKNIQTGWFCIREGQAPERCMDPSLDSPAPSPGENFKRGFVVSVFSPKFFNGVAELSSASIHMGNAIRELYQAFEDQQDANKGLLPVVSCTGSVPMKDKYGTNYMPVFEISKWAERPEDLADQSPCDPMDVWRGAAPAPAPVQAQHVPPPASAPVSNATAQADF